MTELTPTQRRALRAQAHHLNPVVTIAGNGLTPSVLAEIERSLQAHELIKIRVQGAEREIRNELMDAICAQLEAAQVQHIGNILIVWRERREESITSDTHASPSPSTPNHGTAKTAVPRQATAKSAAAFAAAARRAALIRASAEKRPSPARPASQSRAGARTLGHSGPTPRGGQRSSRGR